MSIHKILVIVFCMLYWTECSAKNIMLYHNYRFCFTVPRLHFGFEKISPDGTGISFSNNRECAKYPADIICDELSVYAGYDMDEDLSRNDWLEEGYSWEERDGWQLNARGVIEFNGMRWYTANLSRIIHGGVTERVFYQSRTPKGSPPVIYTIVATFSKKNKLDMMIALRKIFSEFKYSNPDSATCE